MKGKEQFRFQSNPGPGFTLIELLVVVGVIGVLAGLLLSGVIRAKDKGQSAACLNNHRQLILSCLLYVNDHDNSFPYNLGGSATKQTVADKTFLNWVNNVMSWELDPENTNTFLVATGGLGPYTEGISRVYRCPSDHVLSQLQKEAGWSFRTRSISMNAMIGNAGEFINAGKNTNNPGYRQYFKASEVVNPSKIFAFVEEHPDSINDGYFLNKPNTHEWIDLPAAYHGETANLAFTDGHAERHHWIFSSTKPPARPGAAALPATVPATELGDFYWLMERTSRKNYQTATTNW